MALRSLHLRRTLSLLRHQPKLPSLSHLLTHSNAAISSSSFNLLNRPFTSTSALFLSQRGKLFDPETDEIGPDTILFEGCDYNHWLITIDFPKDANLTREQMIETYVNTAAQIFGSVEEAKKKIYALSTTTYQGFQVECSEETSEKFKGLPGVVFVLPDSYIDPVNKEYGGDKYINGEIIPRPPPVHYGRQKYRDRRPREQMGYQQGPPQNYGPPQQQNYGQNFRPPTQQNYGPPPSQHNGPPPPPPPQQNYGPQPQQNYGPQPPQQNYRPPPPQQNYRQPPPPPPQNYGPPPQQSQQQSNVPPHPQSYGQPPNFPPQQNYGQPPNSASQQNYGQPPNYSPQQNYGPPPNFPPRQNYGQPPNFPPQQNYGQPPRSAETSGPLPPSNAWGGGGVNQAPSHGGNFNQGEGGNFHAQEQRDFQPVNPTEPKNY